MSGSATAMALDPAKTWHDLLHLLLEKSPDFPAKFVDRLRVAKLTFGDRVHCPFLRPFFLSPEDEQRVRVVAEAIADLGERVVAAALQDQSLFAQLHLRPAEERLARLPAGPGRASIASRLDAFLLPNSLKFAEYNGESPAGAGYSETLADVFRELPIFAQFSKLWDIHTYPLSAKLLDALIAAYVDFGGGSIRPQLAIVDWREVPTWSEFEILKKRFEKLRVPVILADPRELEFDGTKLTARGKKIELVYRRALINDIVSRPKECEALVKAYEARAVCVANDFRCKIAHVKAFFAVLTDECNAALFSQHEKDVIRRHIPWTRVVSDTRTMHYEESIDLLSYIRENRSNLVLKPSDEYGGTGVTLGWEADEKTWDATIEKAVAAVQAGGEAGCWIVQERIPIRREVFPFIANASAQLASSPRDNRTSSPSDRESSRHDSSGQDFSRAAAAGSSRALAPEAISSGNVEYRDMLVDFAPYLFQGKVSGFLTRLSATGLANVTSGGGQVPGFRVRPRKQHGK
jgi:hypothetical protein